MALVSIGIPTYDRADSLRRALGSAIDQTHGELEIVVSDNGSSDGTRALCEEWAARDQRVRYLRQEVNRGPIANFNAVIAALGGDHVLLLADDDWLEPDYVERCLAELAARPDHAVVAGLPRHVADGAVIGDGQTMTLGADDPRARVRRYLATVEDNGAFYGLMRRGALQGAAPMRDVLGGDWLLMAAIVFGGRLRTLPDVRLNRSLGGTSATIEQILTTVGAGTPRQARWPYLSIAVTAFADIGWRAPAYAPLGRCGRLWLALTAAPRAVRWKYSAWHIAGPALVRLRRRPRARGAVDAVIRRGGGTPPSENTELPDP
jgi:glycosyltransferase involved in cell wall biosynthesis